MEEIKQPGLPDQIEQIRTLLKQKEGYILTNPRFLPVGEQIFIEEELIRHYLDENGIKQKNLQEELEGWGLTGKLLLYRDHPKKIARLGEEEDLLKKRLQELAGCWYDEDGKARQQAGAKWEDLNELLVQFDLGVIEPKTLRRPILQRPNGEIPAAYYMLPAPLGERLKIFGNIVIVDNDFDRIVDSLGLRSEVKRQIRIPGRYDNEYRLVVPYANWVLTQEDLGYDRGGRNFWDGWQQRREGIPKVRRKPTPLTLLINLHIGQVHSSPVDGRTNTSEVFYT